MVLPLERAAPAEGAVTVVEEQRSHDVFHIAWEDEAVMGIGAVLRHLFDASVVDGAQEGVAVVEEVAAAVYKYLYQFKMFSERPVDEQAEFFRFFLEQPRALLKGNAGRAVSAVIGGVAARLVGEQVDGDVMVDGVLQQIDDVAVEGDRADFAAGCLFLRHLKGLFRRPGDPPDPPLFMARFDPRQIHFGGYRYTAGDVRRLGLRAAHAAEAGGDVEPAFEFAALRAELDAARVEDRVVGAVDDALRPDVHPAARRHLSVIRDAELHRAVPLLLIVKEADHQAVGEHHARRGGG